jgi:hypothetical protein
MDNAQAQIEELKQEIASLRDQLACAEFRILNFQTDLASLEKISKSEIIKMWKRFEQLTEDQQNYWNTTTGNMDYIYKRLREIDTCIWPVVYKVFPKYSADLKRIEDLIGQPASPPGEIRPTQDRS